MMKKILIDGKDFDKCWCFVCEQHNELLKSHVQCTCQHERPNVFT